MAERHTKSSFGVSGAFKGRRAWETTSYPSGGKLSPLSVYFSHKTSHTPTIGSVTCLRGPIPAETTFAYHPMDLDCNLCTWVAVKHMAWELKFINRICPHHGHLIKDQEWQ